MSENLQSILDQYQTNKNLINNTISERDLDLAWEQIEQPITDDSAYLLSKIGFNYYISNNDFNKAELWLSRMIKINNETNSNNIDCRFHLGQFYYETNQLQLAKKHWLYIEQQEGIEYFQDQKYDYVKFLESSKKHLPELTDLVYSKVRKFIDKGNKFIERDQLLKAVQEFQRGLNVLPKPDTNWEIATNLYLGIGDATFFMGQFKEANEAYLNAYASLSEKENAYIFLRLGQTFYELQDLDTSKEYLTKALKIGGDKLFSSEDKKYYEFIREHT